MHRTFLYQLGRMILTQEITDTAYLLKMTLVDLESKEYSKGLKIEIQLQFETFGSSMRKLKSSPLTKSHFSKIICLWSSAVVS